MSVIIDASIKKAAKGAVFVFAGSIVSSLLLFAIKILIVRTTTTDELGAYTLAVAVATIVTLAATLGVHEGIARFISLLVGKGNYIEASSLSRTALRTILISGTSAGFLLFFSSNLLASGVFHSNVQKDLLKIVSISVPFYVLLHILVGILRGHGIVVSKIFFMDIGIPLLFAISLFWIFYWKQPFLNIIYAYVFSIVFICSILMVFSYKKIGLLPFFRDSSFSANELMKFSLPLLIGIVMALVMNWTDILFLGRYTGSKAVGIYDVGNALSRLLQFPLNALEFVFLPVAGELYTRGHTEELARTYQVLTKWVFFLTFPIFLILFIYPEQIITFLFGVRFISAVPALRILSCGYLFHTLWGPNGILMVIVGMTREISFVSTLGVFINVVSNYILISWYAQGTIGASRATVATYFSLNLLVSFIIFRKTGIQPFTNSYLKSIAGAVTIGGFFFAFSDRLPFTIWHLPLYLLVVTGGYWFILLLTRSIDKEDVAFFKTVLARVLGVRA